MNPSRTQEDVPTVDGQPRATNASIRAFFDQWHVYDVLVRNDYMAHAGIHQALRAYLSVRKRPFSLIDLGCGDASQMAKTLKGLAVRQYVGVDLSPVALLHARKNMSGVADKISFVENDLITFLDSEGFEPVDVIVAGFAAHHLNESDKRRLLQLCRTSLNGGGALCYYDVFRRQEETREAFFGAFFSNLDRNWTALSSEERTQVKDHILACDRPETYETIAALASEAGFTAPDKPHFEDELRFHRLYCFTPSSVRGGTPT